MPRKELGSAGLIKALAELKASTVQKLAKHVITVPLDSERQTAAETASPMLEDKLGMMSKDGTRETTPQKPAI